MIQRVSGVAKQQRTQERQEVTGLNVFTPQQSTCTLKESESQVIPIFSVICFLILKRSSHLGGRVRNKKR